MKNNLLRLSISFVTITVLCAGTVEAGFWSRLFGKKDQAEAAPAAEAPAASSGQTSVLSQTPASSFATSASAATASASASSTASAASATSAASGLKLNAQTALETASSVKDALSSITANGQQLRALLGSRPELQGILDKALDAAKKGDDLLAIDQLKELGEAASLSTEQKKLVGDLKKDFEVLALGRNFPENGPVGDAITQLKGGDYTKALSTLGDVAKDTSLTEKQRSVINKVIQQYAGDLKRLLPF